MTLPLKTTPSFITQTEWAISRGDQLILIPKEQKLLFEAKHKLVPISRIIFGLRIPYLPDLMRSPNLTGTNERERLVEIWQRQVSLISILGKWKTSSFSLRFLWNPDRKKIETALLVAGLSGEQQSTILAQKSLKDISQLFSSYNIPTEPIFDIDTLQHFLDPLPNGYIAEVRQQEKIMSMIKGDAYVVLPYATSSQRTWFDLFRNICNQTDKCLINIHLESTTLTDYESTSFARKAQLAASLAHENYDGLAGRYEWNDPIAESISKIYKGYLQRLRSPYLLVAQLVSSDPYVSRNMAQNLVAEVSESGNENPSQEDVSTGAQFVFALNSDDIKQAKQTLTSLDLSLWGNKDAGDGQERLQFLVDAKSASSLFRFPIAIRGGIPGIITREVTPNHETGSYRTETRPEEIYLGKHLNQGGNTNIPIAFLNRHTLVVGTTNSGKTTTCFQLLSQLYEKKIPFLVIEPAKAEYRALLESPIKHQLLIFTLGDESISPFRLNPLEIFPGVRVETHISYIKACLEAALPTFGALPSLIEESLHNVYLSKGWDLIDRGKKNETRIMPTLGELYAEIIKVADKRGWSDKTTQDIRTAAASRIGTLLRGSKGRMLNTRRSVPIDLLMNSPVILELESLNDDEKALVMLFLLTAVREYCRSNRSGSQLQHITLIEEAHRVMSATPHAGDREAQADTSATAVKMVSATLSEVRAYGEGLVIAEQIPTRLAEDALKNTNLKIIHRLPGEDDRKSVGATMNMETEQQAYLIKLASGEAAIFMEGYERPAFTSIHNYRAQHHLPENVADDEVSDAMEAFRVNHMEIVLPYAACQFCIRQCKYRDKVANTVLDYQSSSKFDRAFANFWSLLQDGAEIDAWAKIVEFCQMTMKSAGYDKDIHAAYCYLVHSFPGDFPKEYSIKFRQAYLGVK